MKKQFKICVVGLGYVGLPLAIEFSKYYEVVGFDLSKKRINSLKKGKDINNEFDDNFDIKKNIIYTSNIKDIKFSNFYIVCVPTPVFKSKKPNLNNLINACKIISRVIDSNDTVVFESTVFPTTTEKICLPIIEKNSNLKSNLGTNKYKNGFYLGYSPERINPGDKKNTFTKTAKLVSSNSNYGLKQIYNVYNRVIKAKVIKVSSIQVCESSKIIENIQRDVNIALMNEFAKIFRKMNLDVNEIIKYAATKWNFIKFDPGLVGGHCIGVDPYYLSYAATLNKINPKLIISGRNINDNMYKHLINRVNSIAKTLDIDVFKSKILIMGYTFKENCADIRNTQVDKIYKYYLKKSKKIQVYDPVLSEDVFETNKINYVNFPTKKYYDIILVIVPHDQILKLGPIKINSFLKKKSFVFDLKNSLKSKSYYNI